MQIDSFALCNFVEAKSHFVALYAEKYTYSIFNNNTISGGINLMRSSEFAVMAGESGE